MPDKAAEKLEPDESRSIRLLSGDTVVEIGVFDYLTGVVAAEMPVSFEQEALKAQSVAARSYLQRALASPKHEGADICADSACCQAYLSPEQLKSSWGDKYAQYSEKISAAVRATDGEYLSYDGKPALAAFHSSSDGATRGRRRDLVGCAVSEKRFLARDRRLRAEFPKHRRELRP